MPDRDKMHKRIELLTNKIKKEQQLNAQKQDPKQLQLPFTTLFYDGKKVNYSQAMGHFQESITNAAKERCAIKRLKWAQVPLSTQWYDVLKMDTSLECKPKNMFLFINALRHNQKLYNIKNLRIYNNSKKKMLQIHMQLISYRVENEK